MSKISKTKKEQMLVVLISIIFILILIVVVTVAVYILNNGNENETTDNATLVTEQIEENEQEAVLEKLYDMTEQDRITYYCAEFFKLVDNGEYEEAYEILYEEYKENYFPTLASFKVYMQDYFPDDFSLDYTNIERLGDIYVLWVDVADTLNGSYGNNFSFNVVIRENDFDDYDLSFSKDSAVGEEE